MFKTIQLKNSFNFILIIFQYFIIESLIKTSLENEICKNCNNIPIKIVGNENQTEVIGRRPHSHDHYTKENIDNDQDDISAGINNKSCLITNKNSTITCYKVFDADLINFQINEIILIEWMNKTFNPSSVLKYFPNVRKLRIENSQNLTHIFNDFPQMKYLENINISWTNFAYTRPTLFQRLHKLRYLDLRWNKLDYMDGPLILSKNFDKLYLTGNPWNCTRNLKWLLNSEKGKHVVDRDQLICNDTKYFGRNLLIVMNYKLILKQECQKYEELRNCSCSMHYIRRSDDGKSLIPIYAVNCSYLNLYNFPSYLPDNTTIFYATNNKISDVKSLRNNAVYRRVIDVYLDFNQIESIDVLEAGYWLRNFRVLSLKGNKLTTLPVYALDNAFENNQQVARLFLSSNPWICECKFIMKFRELLMKYHTIIKDSNDIECKLYNDNIDSYVEKNVILMQRNDVCKLIEESKMNAIEILNFILIGLICFILIKLAYDYYNYRKYGRLPWIITQMP